MSNYKILIIGDSDEAALELQKVLISTDSEITPIIADVENVSSSITAELPGLALVDIDLNGVGKGVEVAEQIWHNHQIPIIYLSAKTNRETLELAKDISVYGYIPKPVVPDTVKAIVELAFFRLDSDENLAQRYVEARLSLIEFSRTHTLDDLLTQALDTVGAFVESPIGFYHFVEPDQKTLSLQQWSTRTLEEFCEAEARGVHYHIDQAGVWVDCVKAKKPVIHNDYASLSHKKGMPEGHATVVRELVVPVMRKNKVVAILGVGNKPTEYNQRDVDIVAYLADVTWEIIAGKKAEEGLHKSVRDWENTFNAVNAAIWILDKNQKILRTNRVAEEMFQRKSYDILGCQCWDVAHGCDHQIEGCPIPMAKKSKRRESMEIQTDGGWFEVVVDPILANDREYLGAVHIITDITQRKKEEEEKENLQQQLLQSQKMEAVGRLAGGVAHDFNNMLGVILGYAELTMRDLQPQTKLYNNLSEVHDAANRSVDLVRQLLAFARRQTALPRILDLNETVGGLLNMIRRLIGEDIELMWVPGANIHLIKIDPAQLDQVLANLCVNARDAITGVGKITVQTKNVSIDKAYSNKHAGFIPGEYVMLAVSDDGCGMGKETVNYIFEPFFTTKEESKGTGLGLATVYGIVKQNEGFINVYSEPGQGTTLKIYFPRSEKAQAVVPKKTVHAVKEGSETILIVEDEETILRLSAEILLNFGYTVISAKTPGEAMSLVNSHPGDIDLLISDVVMPEMNGKELAKKVVELIPGIKVMYMSGYTSDIIIHRGVLQEDVHFLQKPFTIDSITAKVREVLDDSEEV